MGGWVFSRAVSSIGRLRVFTTGSFMVIQLEPSPQPFVVNFNVPIAVSHRSRKQTFKLAWESVS